MIILRFSVSFLQYVYTFVPSVIFFVFAAIVEYMLDIFHQFWKITTYDLFKYFLCYLPFQSTLATSLKANIQASIPLLLGIYYLQLNPISCLLNIRYCILSSNFPLLLFWVSIFCWNNNAFYFLEQSWQYFLYKEQDNKCFTLCGLCTALSQNCLCVTIIIATVVSLSLQTFKWVKYV